MARVTNRLDESFERRAVYARRCSELQIGGAGGDHEDRGRRDARVLDRPLNYRSETVGIRQLEPPSRIAR